MKINIYFALTRTYIDFFLIVIFNVHIDMILTRQIIISIAFMEVQY